MLMNFIVTQRSHGNISVAKHKVWLTFDPYHLVTSGGECWWEKKWMVSSHTHHTHNSHIAHHTHVSHKSSSDHTHTQLRSPL